MSDRMDIERAGYPGPDGSAPLSPIALDFEAAYFEVVFELVADREQSDRWFKSYRLGNSINDALLTALNAQHLAIVARVAQEEREKVIEKMRECWGEAFNCGIAAGHDLSSPSERDAEKQWQQSNAKDWLDSFLRGTP